MDGYADYSDPETDSPDCRQEGIQVRSLLQLPTGSSTNDVLTAIQLLQFQNGKMANIWEALTELLYLGPDTPPSDVLTTIAMYVKEAQFLKEQEQRHLFIIQKLQNDRRDILKRFHLNKPKPPTASRIRTKAQFPRKTAADVDDLGIIDDEHESVADSYETRQKQLKDEMRAKAKVNNGIVNGPLLRLLDDVNGMTTKAKGEPTVTPEESSVSTSHTTGKRKHLQGYVISKTCQKTHNAASIRDNVTTGTKESVVEKFSKASGNSDSVNSATKSKPSKSHYHGQTDDTGKTRQTFMICSEIHVPEKGGCYDIPDLGLRVSIPGGALPQGSTSEKLVIGLTWDDTSLRVDDKLPVGPTLTIRPSGLPFKKPMVVCLHHNVTATSQLDDLERCLRSTNLILMQQSGLKPGEKWLPVEPDPDDPYFTPLGFIAEDNTVMFIKNAGRYTLVPSQKDTLFVPNSLLILVFASYLKADSESVMQLDVYCLEENQANKKLSETLTETLRLEAPPRHLITSHSMTLSRITTFSVMLEDLMEGWLVLGDNRQAVNGASLGQGHEPAVTFTLKHTISHLRCLLAKLSFKSLKQSRDKDKKNESIHLTIDLDQLEKSLEKPLPSSTMTSSITSLTSTKSSTKQTTICSHRSGTFITDYSDDRAHRRRGKEPNATTTNKASTSSSLLRFKVNAVKNQECWIPDWVKNDLVKEVKAEMYSVDKWNNLLADLKMEYLDEILQQSADPVLDLFSYCEVTGISVSKVKQALEYAGFEDSTNVLSSYLNQTMH